MIPVAPRDPHATGSGVLMVIRPDMSKVTEGQHPRCYVCSQRDLELNGSRFIGEYMDYAMLAHYFRPEDGDAVEVYAELTGGHNGHLQFYERASKREFFTNPFKISFVPAH